MITPENIKNLADLSRMKLTEGEMEHLAKEVGSILNYINQITEATGDLKREVPPLHNIFREDEPINKPGEYTEKLIKNAPGSENNYIKVKKIL